MRLLQFAVAWFALSIPASVVVGQVFARQVPAPVRVEPSAADRRISVR